MLFLNRVTSQFEVLRCKLSRELISYGDFYYEDDEDGLIVKATYYHELQKKTEKDKFDDSKLEQAKSLRDYENQLKKAERELNIDTLMDRTIMNRDLK